MEIEKETEKKDQKIDGKEIDTEKLPKKYPVFRLEDAYRQEWDIPHIVRL